jgi:hypothetical protein
MLAKYELEEVEYYTGYTIDEIEELIKIYKPLLDKEIGADKYAFTGSFVLVAKGIVSRNLMDLDIVVDEKTFYECFKDIPAIDVLSYSEMGDDEIAWHGKQKFIKQIYFPVLGENNKSKGNFKIDMFCENDLKIERGEHYNLALPEDIIKAKWEIIERKLTKNELKNLLWYWETSNSSCKKHHDDIVNYNAWKHGVVSSSPNSRLEAGLR